MGIEGGPGQQDLIDLPAGQQLADALQLGRRLGRLEHHLTERAGQALAHVERAQDRHPGPPFRPAAQAVTDADQPGPHQRIEDDHDPEGDRRGQA